MNLVRSQFVTRHFPVGLDEGAADEADAEC
jgi:hypothetical protein